MRRVPGRTDWDDALVRRERDRFRRVVRGRPTDIVAPREGEESVWDYPRPPRVEPEERRVRVELEGAVLASSRRALRVLETSSPPTLYVPPSDVRVDCLVPIPGRSLCEWKGLATYWQVQLDGRTVEAIAWSYPDPFPEYAVLRNWFSFFPARADGCWLGDERVRPQPGEYYGGWVTKGVVGPFKGAPGSESW